MHPTPKLYEVFYISTIASDAPISVVGNIAAKARLFNEECGVTGLLVFDGMRFCQQLEGHQKTVLSLMEKIRHDPRHVDVNILHHGPLAARRFRNFSLGYASVEGEEALTQLQSLGGPAAVAAFMGMMSEIDVLASLPAVQRAPSHTTACAATCSSAALPSSTSTPASPDGSSSAANWLSTRLGG